MEFSVMGDQQVELTAMSLDESEGCLLTGLRDGTVKMWNYSVGECLLTFPNADQLEVSLAPHSSCDPSTCYFPVSPKGCAHRLPGIVPS